MSENFPSPPVWRVVTAFVVAPAVIALAFAWFNPGYLGITDLSDRIRKTFFTDLLVGAYPAALIFGVPAYFALRDRVHPTLVNCAVVGAVIASLPWLLIGLLGGPDASGYATQDGHVTSENGHITLWGLLDLAKLVGPISLLGFFAGGIFWVIAAAGIRQPEA